MKIVQRYLLEIEVDGYNPGTDAPIDVARIAKFVEDKVMEAQAGDSGEAADWMPALTNISGVYCQYEYDGEVDEVEDEE